MEWKDSGKITDQEESPKEEHFDEEQYSPWADKKDQTKRAWMTKVPVLFFLLALAIVALGAALLMLVMDGTDAPVEQQKLAALEGRIKQLGERLDKYDAIDEKVTLIWEQAKTFEKFKDRFDRSEASMSLRMDHLTMSLEAMQKQSGGKSAVAPVAPKAAPVVASSAQKMQYHQVKAGETLYSISKQYGLTVERLLEMNKMAPGSVIGIGQKMIVRTAAK
jgi:LysM repeat protein